MTIEEQLKNLIIDRYGTVVNFSSKAGIPNSSIASIFNRGIDKASVNNIIKICSTLGISVDGLSEGKIIENEPVENEIIELDEVVSSIKRKIENLNQITIKGDKLTPAETKRLIDALEIATEIIKRDH